jgi:hypothetical protein
MWDVRTVSELSFVLPSRPGVLADVSDALGREGIDIDAVLAWEDGDEGHFKLVVDQPDRARQAVEALETDVVVADAIAVDMPNTPGALAKVSRAMADSNVNIGTVYGSTSGDMATIVFWADDLFGARAALASLGR